MYLRNNARRCFFPFFAARITAVDDLPVVEPASLDLPMLQKKLGVINREGIPGLRLFNGKKLFNLKR